MIVGRKIDKIDVPHEPNNRIHIRELSGLEMDDAADITSTKALKRFGSIGAEAIAAIRNDRADIEQAEVDPKTQYDWEYLATHAIVGWDGPDYEGLECNDANRKLLDKVTLEWIIGVIVEHNTVPLEKSKTSRPSLTVAN